MEQTTAYTKHLETIGGCPFPTLAKIQIDEELDAMY
jgi:hypothetical protein